jgi:hypothetical protein
MRIVAFRKPFLAGFLTGGIVPLAAPSRHLKSINQSVSHFAPNLGLGIGIGIGI